MVQLNQEDSVFRSLVKACPWVMLIVVLNALEWVQWLSAAKYGLEIYLMSQVHTVSKAVGPTPLDLLTCSLFPLWLLLAGLFFDLVTDLIRFKRKGLSLDQVEVSSLRRFLLKAGNCFGLGDYSVVLVLSTALLFYLGLNYSEDVIQYYKLPRISVIPIVLGAMTFVPPILTGLLKLIFGGRELVQSANIQAVPTSAAAPNRIHQKIKIREKTASESDTEVGFDKEKRDEIIQQRIDEL